MSNEPTKPAPATDEMREEARECAKKLLKELRRNCWEWNGDAVQKQLHAYASQVLQQAERRIAELEKALADEKLESACARAKFKMTQEFRAAAERERDEARSQVKIARDETAQTFQVNLDLAKRLQQAVQAERERCAEIARAYANMSEDFMVRKNHQARCIAAAILSQPTPPEGNSI